MDGFEGRSAVVTGAAGGMGRAIARMLAAAGASVRMLDISEPSEVPAGASFHRCDLTDPAAVAGAFAGLERLDHLVNAAGVLLFGQDRSYLEIDLDLWDRVMAVNLRSMVLTMRAAVPRMRAAGGGAIVNFATIQCLRGDPAPQDAYQASKAGVIALTRSAAIQHAGEGIRANSILPGPAETPMQARWQADPATRAATAAAIPLGRVGTAEDMANACLFLLSDRAGFITGTELVVDGGLLALP